MTYVDYKLYINQQLTEPQYAPEIGAYFWAKRLDFGQHWVYNVFID